MSQLLHFVLILIILIKIIKKTTIYKLKYNRWEYEIKEPHQAFQKH